jgi:glucan 1,3-beta-glucosidase
LDIPGQKQISVYAGRGILSESCGPVWMIGTGTSPNLSHLQILTLLADSLYVYPFFIFMVMVVLIINKAEHHVLYQYHLVNAANHYMGLIQTETVSNKFLYTLT